MVLGQNKIFRTFFYKSHSKGFGFYKKPYLSSIKIRESVFSPGLLAFLLKPGFFILEFLVFRNALHLGGSKCEHLVVLMFGQPFYFHQQSFGDF